MKWLVIVFMTGVILAMFGCTEKGTESTPPPDSSDAIILDNFDDNNAQNSLGETFGEYKVDNMNDADVNVSWGGGDWYAYASDNGAKVISSDGDTIIDGPGTVSENPDIISKLMSDGKLYVELNCQGCTGDYWSAVACDISGDLEHPYLYDSLIHEDDSSVYWDFSSLDSVKIKMRGTGAALFFFESRAVKLEFLTPDDAYGFHGFSHVFDTVMADTTSYYYFSAKDFVTTNNPFIISTWEEASKEISAFVIEVNTELDDRLEIEIDKIEFIGLDTNVVFPFLETGQH